MAIVISRQNLSREKGKVMKNKNEPRATNWKTI